MLFLCHCVKLYCFIHDGFWFLPRASIQTVFKTPIHTVLYKTTPSQLRPVRLLSRGALIMYDGVCWYNMITKRQERKEARREECWTVNCFENASPYVWLHTASATHHCTYLLKRRVFWTAWFCDSWSFTHAQGGCRWVYPLIFFSVLTMYQLAQCKVLLLQIYSALGNFVHVQPSGNQVTCVSATDIASCNARVMSYHIKCAKPPREVTALFGLLDPSGNTGSTCAALRTKNTRGSSEIIARMAGFALHRVIGWLG